MKTRPYQACDLEACADLLIETYNAEPWNNHWTAENARRYLSEFIDAPRFVGFVQTLNDRIVGAAFCHERTWWNDDELYVDEFYISPQLQRRGYGHALLADIETFVKNRRLAGFTLLTDKYMPAPEFYIKNGFTKADHVIFMYKEV